METSFVNSTVCYIRSNGQTLLQRRAKGGDMHGKWIVPGGKFEPGETPEECVLREVKEETGLDLTEINLRGILTFVCRSETSIKTGTCFVFESFSFRGDLYHSQEGELRWVPDDEIIQFDLPSGTGFFCPGSMKTRSFFRPSLAGG